MTATRQRADLIARVRAAIKDSDYDHMCDFGLSDEDFEVLASAAVDVFAEFLDELFEDSAAIPDLKLARR